MRLTDGVVAIVLTIMVLELKIPGRADPPGGHCRAPAARRLPARLHQRRDLLEQPSPHDAVGAQGDGRRAVGEPCAAVLADPVPADDPLDRRCGDHAVAGRLVRIGADRRVDRLPRARTRADPRRRRWLGGQARGRRRLQGMDQLCALRRGGARRVRVAVHFDRHLRRRVDRAGSSPTAASSGTIERIER